MLDKKRQIRGTRIADGQSFTFDNGEHLIKSGFNPLLVEKCILRIQRSHKKYIWNYQDTTPNEVFTLEDYIREREASKKDVAKKVSLPVVATCMSTGKRTTYPSLLAAEVDGFSASAISEVVNGWRYKHHNHLFEKLNKK